VTDANGPVPSSLVARRPAIAPDQPRLDAPTSKPPRVDRRSAKKRALSPRSRSRGPERAAGAPEIVVAIDAEWVNAARANVEGGTERDNAVLSYQAQVVNAATGRSVKLILYTAGPTKRHRLNLNTLLGKALRKARNEGVIETLPERVALVGHFTRADLSALRDWAAIKKEVDAVRRTLATTLKPMARCIRVSENSDAQKKISIRVFDTMLLSPAGSSRFRHRLSHAHHLPPTSPALYAPRFQKRWLDSRDTQRPIQRRQTGSSLIPTSKGSMCRVRRQRPSARPVDASTATRRFGRKSTGSNRRSS